MVNASLLLTVLPAILSSVAVAAPVGGSFNLPPTRQTSTVGIKTKPLAGASALGRANSVKAPSAGSASSSSGGFQMHPGRPRADAFKLPRPSNQNGVSGRPAIIQGGPGSGGNGNAGGSNPFPIAGSNAAAGIPRFDSIKSSGSSRGFVMNDGRPRANAVGGSSGGFVMHDGRPRANAIASGSSNNQVISGRPAIIQGNNRAGNSNPFPIAQNSRASGRANFDSSPDRIPVQGRAAIIQNNNVPAGGNPFASANQNNNINNGRPAIIQGPASNQVQNGRPAVIQGSGNGPITNSAGNSNPFPAASNSGNSNPFGGATN